MKFFFCDRYGGVIADGEDVAGGLFLIIRLFAILFIATAILGIISAIIILPGLFAYVAVYQFLMPVYDFILIKLLLIPSTFDLTFNFIIENPFLQLLLFSILMVVFFWVSSRLKLKWVRYYLFANTGVLLFRVFFTIFFFALGFFLEDDETLSDGRIVKTEYELENIQGGQYHSYDFHTFTQEEFEEGKHFSDANNESLYSRVLWVDFGNNNDEIGQHSSFSTYFSFEGLLFSSPEDINRFQTTISYAPILEGEEHTNKSTFMVSILADREVVESYVLSPEQTVIHVDIPLKVEETFGIKIEGDIQDNSIVTLLDTNFIRQF